MNSPSLLDVQQTVLRIRDQLAEHLQDRLLSLLQFGSSVTGDFLPDLSDINLLVIHRPGYPRIQLPAEVARRMKSALKSDAIVWAEDRLPILPRAFPLETLEIAQFHRCLHGNDPFDQIQVRPEDLNQAVLSGLCRLQAEIERILLMELSSRTPFDTLYDFVFLIRGVLRTQGIKPARAKKDSLEQFAEKYDTAITTAKVLVGVRDRSIGPPGEHERRQMFEYYLKDVERVIGVAERLIS